MERHNAVTVSTKTSAVSWYRRCNKGKLRSMFI